MSGVPEDVATNLTPVTSTRSAQTAGWRRAAQVAAAVLLVVASVAAQAVDLTPVAIVLLVAGVITAAPLALPSLDL